MAWKKECGMNNYLRSIAAATLLLWGGQAALAASPPVGLTVYAEEWNPAKPNSEALKVLENNPTLLSDTLNKAWGIFSKWYLSTIPSQIHAQNYLNKISNGGVPQGITLYDRMGNTNLPPEMSFPAQIDLKLVAEGVDMFRADFLIPGSSISLCSTTPSLARQADPCVDLAVDMTFSLSLKISDDPNQLLKVAAASVNLSNFKYSKANLSTDIALVFSEIVDFFGGPNYTAMIVHTIDTTSIKVTDQIQSQAISGLNAMIGKYEQTALATINQQLQPAVSFTRLVHLAVWAQSQQNSQTLNLLFAPPPTGITIDQAHQTGQISGKLTFDSSIATPSCSNFNTSSQIAGQVQVGPRPIVAINAGNPVYGTAPLQPLAVVFQGGAMQGLECQYTLSRLSVGLPNILNFSSFAYKATGNASVTKNVEIQPVRWSSPVLLGPNGKVISAGAASASQPTFARTAVPTNATRLAPSTVSSAPQTTTQSWNTAARQDMQTTNLQSLDLAATTGFSVQTGAGAMPRQATLGTVSPVDPAANQAKTAWGTAPQATATVPAWGNTNAATAAPGVATGTSLQRGATLNRATTLQTQQQQQQAAPKIAAPASLQAP
jgi:hypothetical protein